MPFQKQKSPEQNTVYSETEKLAEGGGGTGVLLCWREWRVGTHFCS